MRTHQASKSSRKKEPALQRKSSQSIAQINQKAPSPKASNHKKNQRKKTDGNQEHTHTQVSLLLLHNLHSFLPLGHACTPPPPTNTRHTNLR